MCMLILRILDSREIGGEMNISIDEFKQLIDLIDKPIEIKTDPSTLSFTIPVKCKKDSDVLIHPLKIEEKEISQLGIYDIKGIKFWIVI